ncbi:MAG: aromatic amino acid lyase [Halohasta sp.]
MTEIVVDGESLTPADVEAVARHDATVAVAEQAREDVRTSRERIEDILDTDEAVYGVNTGFGELVRSEKGRGLTHQAKDSSLRICAHSKPNDC